MYQLQVYEYAATLVATSGMQSVLDIGCGVGTKLVDYIGPLCNDITGVDMEHSILKCRELFTQGEWIVGDLENPDFSLGRTYDLIISADVIEHLQNPDRLLDLARHCSHEATTIVLSTPERDLRRGNDDMGPPANPGHIREWNSSEFAQYLQSRGLIINDTRIVDLREGITTCQMVTATFQA